MQGHKVGPSEDDDVSNTPKESKQSDEKKDSPSGRKESKKFKNKRSDKKGYEKADGSKFEGEGMMFKAKLIGLEDVFEARGDQLCQDTLHRLKAAIKSSGTHKTRITLFVSLEGIKIKDDKTGDILYHHPVHKISFISQDISDSRAFGYIYSHCQTGHQFVGIKTEKMAAHVVIALRDLFQAVLELKKKEIFKAETEERQQQKDGGITEDAVDGIAEPSFSEPIYSEVAERNDSICDLLDLRTELDQLQEGIAQMNDSIAASAILVQHAILSPQKVVEQEDIPTAQKDEPVAVVPEKSEAAQDKYAVFAEIDAVPSLFDNPAAVPEVQLADTSQELHRESPPILPNENPWPFSPKSVDFSIFEDLDPLGKGRPFVSKEDFFRDIKTPPKKTLKDFPGGSDSFDGPSDLPSEPTYAKINKK